MTTNTGKLTIVIVALLALAAAPWLGWWIVGIVGVVGVPLLILGSGNRSGGNRHIATALGVLGGLVGAASATSALWRVGNQPDYAARAPFGWLALALALGALVGGLLSARQPTLARVLLLGGSLLGFIAINLLYINTFYFLALPLCWLGAIMAGTGDTARRARGEQKRDAGYGAQ